MSEKEKRTVVEISDEDIKHLIFLDSQYSEPMLPEEVTSKFFGRYKYKVEHFLYESYFVVDKTILHIYHYYDHDYESRITADCMIEGYFLDVQYKDELPDNVSVLEDEEYGGLLIAFTDWQN